MNAGKNGRDAAFTTIAAAAAGIVGIHYGSTDAEKVLIVTLVSAALGLVLPTTWRVVRHYLPWIDDDAGAGPND